MKRVMIHDAPTDETDDEGEIIKESFIQPPEGVKKYKF